MNDYIKVSGHEDMVRDMNTGAIISTASKFKQKSLSGELKNMSTEINILKEEMSEIKSLLKQLIK